MNNLNEPEYLDSNDPEKNHDYWRQDHGGMITNHNGIADKLLQNDKLYNQIQEIQRTFEEQRVKFENIIEEKMNDIVKDPKKGIGFAPTVKNIFAVLLANAEVFIRLMKQTHSSAFDVSEKRKKIILDSIIYYRIITYYKYLSFMNK